VSILDSLPAAVNAAMASLFRPAALKGTVTRVSDGRGGFEEVFSVHACRALVTDYTAYQRAAGSIPADERKVLVLAASIADGRVPRPSDTITIQGRVWDVVEVTSDPANATYEARCR
jgi:hypothetical protein